MLRSSTPELSVPDTVKEEASESIAADYAASVTVEDEVTYDHDVLFGRAVVCGEKVRPYYPSRLLKMCSDHAQQNIDASTQNFVAGNSSDSPLLGTRTAKKSTAEASTQTCFVASNSNGSPSSPNLLINMPTDYPSPVATEEDKQQDRFGLEDPLPEAQNEEEPMQEVHATNEDTQTANQELNDQFSQLMSSIKDLKEIVSQEGTRITAAEERATAAEGRAAAAEGRLAVVAGRATNLGTQMERLSQGLGTPVNRAAKAEEESMRVHLKFLGMPSGSSTSDHEAVLDQDQDQPSNDIGQAQEENRGAGVPLDAQAHAEDHEIRETPAEEIVDVTEDGIEEAASASSTPMVQEALLSTEMAAHQQTRDELARFKERIARKDSQLEKYRRLLEEKTKSYEELRGIQNELETQLDDAELRISELGVAEYRLGFRIDALQKQVADLETESASRFNTIVLQNDMILRGTKELNFFIRLGTKLHARVKQAEKQLKGALGRADGLMRLAERRLPIHVRGQTYFGDFVDEEVDNNEDTKPKVRLAIEGPPAEFSGEQNIKMVPGHEAMSDDVDIERLVSEFIEMRNGTVVDNSNVADIGAKGPAFNNSNIPDAENVASSGVHTATSEGTPKESGFTFSLETPFQESRQQNEDAVKPPVFAFGGTPIQESRKKAKSTANVPMFQFSTIPSQENQQQIPSVMTPSPHGFHFSRQTAVPDVSGVQAVEESSKDGAQGIHVKGGDKKDEQNDQKGAAGFMLGNHEVTRDTTATSANQPDTPKAEGNAQDFKSEATTPLFGAQASPSPVLNSDANSSTFNFASAADFNFGATTTFQAGSDIYIAKPEAFGGEGEDERNEGPTKKTKTAPIYEAATSIDLSSSSSKQNENSNKKNKTAPGFEAASINMASPSFTGSENEAAKKTKAASIFEAAASVILSPLSSENKAALVASSDHDSKDASEALKFTSGENLDFSSTAAKGEGRKQEPALQNEIPPMFGARLSNQFSFSPSGIPPTFGGFSNGPEGAFKTPSAPKPCMLGETDKQKQKQASAKKTADAPIFAADAFAKFDSPASGKKVKFDQFNLGIAGASEIEPNAVSSVLGPGLVAANPEQKQKPDPKVANEDLEGLYRDAPLVAGRGNEDVQHADDMSLQPSSAYPAECENTSVAGRYINSVEGLRGIPRGLDGCPGPEDNNDSLYEIEDDYQAPTKEPAKVEHVGVEPAPAIAFAVESTQGSFSTLPAQLPDPSVSSDSSQSACAAARDTPESSPTEANEAGGEVWQGSSRTAAEIDASWELECRQRAISTLADGVNEQQLLREPEWPAALPPLAAAATTVTSMQPSGSTQAAVSNLGANHGICPTVSPEISEGAAHALETAPMTIRNADGHSNLVEVEAIEGTMRYAVGGMERLYIGPPTPPAFLRKFDPEVHFLSGDWIARRSSMKRCAVDLEKEVDTEGESVTWTEEVRGTEVLSESVRQVEQDIATPSEPHVTESPTLNPTDMRDLGRVLTARRNGRVPRVVGQRVRHPGREVAREPEDELQVTESPTPSPPESGNEEVLGARAGEAQAIIHRVSPTSPGSHTHIPVTPPRARPMATLKEAAASKDECIIDNAPSNIKHVRSGAFVTSHEDDHQMPGITHHPHFEPLMSGALQDMEMDEDAREHGAEDEVARETEPLDMNPATRSNDGVETQMPPQSEQQMEDDTTTSEMQAPQSMAETAGESREQTKDPPAKKPSEGLHLWSLRKKR